MEETRSPSLSPASSTSPTLSKAPSKRAGGAPKAKGSVRAKSGCYTCRIRRKKCDEAPDAQGRCSTCVRLRLQCLGFGQKRPEWLKENNNVSVFREKIKEFLAAQGMIKGHSGANSRADEAQQMLILVADADRVSSSEDSPPPPPQQQLVEHPHQHQQRYRTHSIPQPLQPQPHTVVSQQHQHPHPHQAYHSLQMPPPSSSVSHVAVNGADGVGVGYGNPSAAVSEYYAPPTKLEPQLVFTSTLPPSYSQHYVIEDEEPPPPAPPHELQTGHYAGADYAVPAAYTTHIPPTLSVNVFPQVTDAQNGLVRHYLAHVLYRQYLLADASIQDFIVRTIQSSGAVRDAVCLLASLHQQSLRRLAAPAHAPPQIEAPTEQDNATYERICLTLQKPAPGAYTEAEALTGLLVVSAFLFRGGRGAWGQFLNVAADFVAAALMRAPADPASVLHAATSSQRFVMKTTFWFDILASTTRGLAPRFLASYRALWGPAPGAAHAYIGPLPVGGGPADEISMLSVMGADNATALALAETAALAAWRDAQAARGALSVPELADRAARIQSALLDGPRSPEPPAAALAGARSAAEELRIRRRLTANIFRATARVYLHATVSGNRPRVPEIRAAVRDALAALAAVPAARSSLSSGVLRSVVFGICVTGCLTDVWEERQAVLERLEREREEGVGNCDEARRVVEHVWARRDAGEEDVSWREVVHQLGGETLLLV